MSAPFGAIDGNNHLFQKSAQQLFAIAIRGGRRFPDFMQIGTERKNFLFLFLAQRAWTLSFPPFEFRFCSGEIAQALFPLGFESACHESVFGLDRTILTLGSFGFIASAFHCQTPLTECCIVVGFELLHGQLCCFESRGRQSFEKSIGNGLIDLNTTDVQTVHSASANHILARAMISGRRGSTRVVSVEPTATLPTSSEALQQCAAFSHGAARLVWLRMLVGINACLVDLERDPVNETGMMFGKKHGPLRHGQKTGSLAESSLVIDVAFTMRLPVRVSASIHRIGEYLMDGVVAGGDPSDRALHMGSQRERKTFGAEPQPDLADRSQFGKFGEDRANGAHDGFVGMEPDFAVLFSPHEAHGQASTQFPACSFIANSTLEPCAKNVQFRFRHDAL